MPGKIQLHVDGEWVDLGEATVEFTIDVWKLQDALIKTTDKWLTIERCQERCKCDLWKCVGKEPHEPRFGPFHVFPQHPCNDLANPQAALDAAADSTDHSDESSVPHILDPEPHSQGTWAEYVDAQNNDGAPVQVDQPAQALFRPQDHSLGTTRRANLTIGDLQKAFAYLAGEFDSPREPLPSDSDSPEEPDQD